MSKWSRRARRWAKHTPNAQMAITLLTSGAVLLVGTLVFAFLAL